MPCFRLLRRMSYMALLTLGRGMQDNWHDEYVQKQHHTTQLDMISFFRLSPKVNRTSKKALKLAQDWMYSYSNSNDVYGHR